MKTMPRQRFTLRELCLMTFLAVFGMLFKPLVSPAFNLITDFVRVPGGSMTAGFSLLFLVFAAARIRKPGTALLMGLVQAAMSLSMGISATAGILVFITYTMPGAAIDLILCSGWFDRFPLKLRMSAAGAAGVLAGAALYQYALFPAAAHGFPAVLPAGNPVRRLRRCVCLASVPAAAGIGSILRRKLL